MAIVLMAAAVDMHYKYSQNQQQFVSFRFSEQMTSTTQMLPEFLVWIVLTGFLCISRHLFSQRTRAGFV